MSPPTRPAGDLQRIVALLTAVEGLNHRAIDELLGEFTRADALRMAAMYLEAIRQQAGDRGLPMPVALQVFGRVAARHVEARGGRS